MKTPWSMETLKLLPFSPANVVATVRPLSQARVRVTVFGLLLPGSATAGAAISRSPQATRPMQVRHRNFSPFVAYGEDSRSVPRVIQGTLCWRRALRRALTVLVSMVVGPERPHGPAFGNVT